MRRMVSSMSQGMHLLAVFLFEGGNALGGASHLHPYSMGEGMEEGMLLELAQFVYKVVQYVWVA